MILIIDSTYDIKLALYDANFFKTRQANRESHNLLKEINRFFKENKVSPKNLEGIVINRGPGSYTSTRVGISVANALGFALNIPVIGIICRKKVKLKSLAQRGYQKIAKVKKFVPAVPYYRTFKP